MSIELSIVLPVYDEAENVAPLHAELTRMLEHSVARTKFSSSTTGAPMAPLRRSSSCASTIRTSR